MANTKALLHFDGADGGTTFTDWGGHTFTGAGNAQLDTAQKKFGTASLLLDGNGDYLTTPDSADWDLGDNWTIDFWVRFASTTGAQCFLQQFQDGLNFWTIEKMADHRLRIRIYDEAEVAVYRTTNVPTFSADTWYHLEFAHNGSTNFLIFVDGVSFALTQDVAWTSNRTYAGQLNIGRNEDLGGAYVNGWIDELRFVTGETKHTSNFTPETAAYPDASPSPSVSVSASISPSPSASISPTPSSSISPSPSPSPSASVSPSSSISPSPSISVSASISPSPSISVSASISPTGSPSPSLSPSSSVSPSSSISLSPSPSPSISVSLSPSPSPSVSVSLSPSPSPSLSGSPSPSLSASLSESASPSSTGSPSPSPSPSVSVSLSPSVSPSLSPSVSASISESRSPSPSHSPSISASGSPSPSVSVSPSPGQPYHVYTREAKVALPTSRDDLSPIYTTQEENDVYSYDDTRVCITGAANRFLLHQFKKRNDNRKDSIKIRVDLRSSLAPSSRPVYLQIWNGTTLSWETLDSNTTKRANTDLTLRGSITTDQSIYYDFGNEVAVRVYQENDAQGSQSLCVDKVQISFVLAYSDKYTPGTSTYTPKYPHKNPQDDDDN